VPARGAQVLAERKDLHAGVAHIAHRLPHLARLLAKPSMIDVFVTTLGLARRACSSTPMLSR